MSNSQKPILVVVEGDVQFLETLLSKFRETEPRVDLVGVDTAEKSLDIVVHHPVDAVLVAGRIPDMSGVALLSMIKNLHPGVNSMIMTDRADYELQKQRLKEGDTHYIDRNSDLNCIVEKVCSLLFEEEVGFRGILENLDLPDILQLLCSRGETTKLRINSENNSGIILIEKGEVVHARTNTKQGEEAFFDLFSWKGGAFGLKHIEHVDKKTISKTWQRLMLEAGQVLDERSGPKEGSLLDLAQTSPNDGGSSLDAQHGPIDQATSREDPLADRLSAAPLTDPNKDLSDTVSPQVLLDMDGVEPSHSALKSRFSVTAPPGSSALAGIPNLYSSRSSKRENRSARGAHSVTEEGSLNAESGEGLTVSRTGRRGGTKASVSRADKRALHSEQSKHSSFKRKRYWRINPLLSGAILSCLLLGTVVALGIHFPWLLDPNGIAARVRGVFAKRVSTDLPQKINTIPTMVHISTDEQASSSGSGIDALSVPDEGSQICAVVIAPLKEFSTSGNIVAMSSDLFEQLGLLEDSWVEITASNGVHLGAYAIKKMAKPSTMYIRRTMASALGIVSERPSWIQVRPVEWSQKNTKEEEVVFHRTRKLSRRFSEFWYTVGVSLSTMERVGLSPGGYALVKGPSGYQSVQVQVMDRGNPGEIWLNDSVSEAIGVNRGLDTVRLYPKAEPNLE